MTKFILRDYQQEAVDAAMEYMKKKAKPAVIVAPTGTGKSLLISTIAKQIERPVVVLQPSKELLEQNYEKFIAFGGEGTISSASLGVREISHVTYATLGSVKNNVEDFKRLGVDTVLVDEADGSYPPEKGSVFRDFIDALQPKNIIGFTATPFRLKRYGNMLESWSQLNMMNRIRPMIFHDIIHITQVQKAVDEKYWAKIEYEQWDFDASMLILNSTGGDYTEKSMNNAILRNGVHTNILIRAKALIEENKSCLIFMDSVENAKLMAQRLPKAAVLEANTPNKERTEVIRAFKAGEIKAICNVNVLSIGFDYPELDCVILGRPTLSYRVYMQQVGRVVRNPLYPLQKQALVIDFCNNVKRFGKAEDLEIKEYEGYGWGATAQGKLLTGVPMGTEVMLESVIKPLINTNKDFVMDFGEHRGKKITSVPKSYLKWFYQKIDGFYPRYSKKQIEELKQTMAEIFISEKMLITDNPDVAIALDFNNVIYRLYARRLLNEDGFEQYIQQLKEKFQTNNVYVFRDSKKKTYWRNTVYPEYKDHRVVKEQPKQFLNGLNDILANNDIIIETSLEADDLIADLVRSNRYKQVYVVSSDSDFRQLGFFKCYKAVDPSDLKFNTVTQIDAVYSLVEKVLKGDSSDNIKKSHNQKMIRTALLKQITKTVFQRLLNYCKTGLCTDVNTIPLKKIIYEELSKRIDMDKDLFDMNYELVCLIQNRRPKEKPLN